MAGPQVAGLSGNTNSLILVEGAKLSNHIAKKFQAVVEGHLFMTERPMHVQVKIDPQSQSNNLENLNFNMFMFIPHSWKPKSDGGKQL